jgi:glutamine synthetase
MRIPGPKSSQTVPVSPTFKEAMSVQRTPSDVLQFAQDGDARMLDLRFADLPGRWQHVSYPISVLTEASFTHGFGLDGSSVRGWQAISESDMLILPDPNTAFMDPFTDASTLVIICNVVDPLTKQPYERDPRWIAQKAEKYLALTGVGDTAYFGAGAEFFVFDNVRFDQRDNSGYYFIDSEDGQWGSGNFEGASGHRPRDQKGAFPVPPTDHHMNLRAEMVNVMTQCGIEVRAHHPGAGTGGQCEIDQKFDSLVNSADKMMLFKNIVRNVAFLHGQTATFMPKPRWEDSGSGMHTHQSIWQDGKPLFAGDQYAGLSEIALHYVGGLLKHSAALAAFCAPTTNSYKRLVPGTSVPVNLAYSRRNRSVACRIPMLSMGSDSKRVELRFPDPAANPYLAFAAMLMAGLDGIQNRIDPGEPLDSDIEDLTEDELQQVTALPSTLAEALDALEADHEFLTENDVFTEELIRSYIEHKRSAEVDAIRERPHPHEFSLYYDI